MMNSHSGKGGVAQIPYPRRCAECGEVAVQAAVISYDAKVKHDGKLHAFHIDELPVERCSACIEVFFTNATADAKSSALRKHLGLLQPEEIRELLSEHRLTQRKLAEHLRIAEESVSRWINGLSIQSRALDAFMRIYFASAQVRELLAREEGIPCSKQDSAKTSRSRLGLDGPTIAVPVSPTHPVFGRRFPQSTLDRCRRFQLIPDVN